MSENKYRIGFPFLNILALVFITLKLTGHITWSWLWVLAPIWIPFSIIFAIFLIVLTIMGIAKISEGR